MKILFKIMLVFLLVLCATAAAVVIIHLKDGGINNKDAYIADKNYDADVDVLEIIYDDGFIDEEEENAYRLWQRVATKSEETGLYHYYPIIPWDILPGETAVLSVSAEGFIGWEADPNFADVEFFDENLDGENAYISFTMPDKEVSIAAIYTDEIPQINFDNTNDMLMAYEDMHEYGSAPVAMSLGALVPRPGPAILMDPGYFNELYFAEFDNPDITVLPGRHLEFEWNFPMPALLGLSWNAYVDEYGVHNGGNISGRPQTVGGPNEFSVNIIQVVTETGVREGSRGTFWFSLTILPTTDDPEIVTTRVPDAMVGVPYDAPLITVNFQPGNWILSSITGDDFTDLNTINTGLSLWREPPNGFGWAIRGTPTEEALTGGGSGAGGVPGVYRFTITLAQTDASAQQLHVIPSAELSIKIWEQPEITSSQLLVDTVFLPGIFIPSGDNNVQIPYSAELDANGSSVSPAATSWIWSVSNGSLPSGLNLTTPGTNSVSITGTPTAPTEPGGSTFTIRYRADPNVLIGWVDYTYNLEIFAPPQFDTGTFALPDGMDWRPKDVGGFGLSEKPDDDYVANIYASGLPNYMSGLPGNPSITWTWSVVAGTIPTGPGLLDPGNPMTFAPSLGNDSAIIKGNPQNTDPGLQTYKFSVGLTAATSNGNVNINTARVAQDYEIKIWERRYLVIEQSGDTRLFVRRVAKSGAPLDVAWDAPGFLTGTDANLFRYRRAVMPGTQGEIRMPLSSTGFVRWEVLPGSSTNANDHVIIGSNYKPASGEPPSGTNAFVTIDMPSYNSAGVPVDGDVYIRGVDDDEPTFDAPFNDGTVGDMNSSGFIYFTSDLGNGNRQVTWELLSDEATTFPPGMRLMGSNSVAMLMSVPPGGPTEAGIFTFDLGINLPGSMRIDETFTFIVNPVPDTLLGDVDGNEVLDLRDLIMLAQFVRGERSSLPNKEAGNIVSKAPANPNLSDLNVLAEYFARPDVLLSTPPTSP